MRNLLRCFAVAIGLFAVAAPAIAAETPVYEFDRNMHVYLDPNMAQRTPLSQDFADQLVTTGRQKGLDVYLVVAQRGDELATTQPSLWARIYFDRMYTAWKYAPGYDESNVEIIVYLRDPASMAGSIFVHAGRSLLNAGVSQQVLRDANGPVVPISRAEVRTDAQRAFLDIQASVNHAMDVQATLIGGHTILFWIVVIVVILIVLWLLCACAGGGGGGFFFIGGGCSSGGGSSCSSCSSDT